MNEFSSADAAPPAGAPPAADVVAELRAAAEAKARALAQAAEERLQDWKVVAERALGDSKGHWKEVSDQAMAYARQNPGKAVLAGLGAGFVIGLLFREK